MLPWNNPCESQASEKAEGRFNKEEIMPRFNEKQLETLDTILEQLYELSGYYNSPAYYDHCSEEQEAEDKRKLGESIYFIEGLKQED